MSQVILTIYQVVVKEYNVAHLPFKLASNSPLRRREDLRRREEIAPECAESDRYHPGSPQKGVSSTKCSGL